MEEHKSSKKAWLIIAGVVVALAIAGVVIASTISRGSVTPPEPVTSQQPEGTTTPAPAEDDKPGSEEVAQEDPNALPEGQMRSYLSGLPVDEYLVSV